ncbi:MAG TPA: cytochrome b/b6 domain-containing protein [Sphingomicrobium sp.]|nr:cytochrome b/b6 domain-containing protein [Sphingomicrobium sp.]
MTTVPEAAPQRPLLRHSNFAATIHWLVVLLLLTQVWLGFTFHDMPRGPARAEFFTWHKTVGATILVLTLVRLFYRLRNPPPPYPPDMPEWRRFAGVWTHRLLYTLLILLPLTGLVAVSGRADGWFTPLVGNIPLPVVPGIDETTGELSGGVHEILVFTTIALLALHIGAGLYEAFIARDGVGYRMPPFRSREGEPVVIGQGEGSRREEG